MLRVLLFRQENIIICKIFSFIVCSPARTEYLPFCRIPMVDLSGTIKEYLKKQNLMLDLHF